jgi:hypothetical protein
LHVTAAFRSRLNNCSTARSCEITARRPTRRRAYGE